MPRSLLLMLLAGCAATEPAIEVAGTDAQERDRSAQPGKLVPHHATRPPPTRSPFRDRRIMGGQEGEPVTGSPGVDGAADPDLGTGGEDDGDPAAPPPSQADTGDTGDTGAP